MAEPILFLPTSANPFSIHFLLPHCRGDGSRLGMTVSYCLSVSYRCHRLRCDRAWKPVFKNSSCQVLPIKVDKSNFSTKVCTLRQVRVS